jgi:hypothetical protein
MQFECYVAQDSQQAWFNQDPQLVKEQVLAIVVASQDKWSLVLPSHRSGFAVPFHNHKGYNG